MPALTCGRAGAAGSVIAHANGDETPSAPLFAQPRELWDHALSPLTGCRVPMTAVPPNAPASPLRRRLLKAAVLAPTVAALASLPGCSLPEQVDGTFLQPWLDHQNWSAADWQRSMELAQRAGCRDLVVQWSGILGGAEGDWQLSEASFGMLFNAADHAGINVRVGLPFEQRWWKAISGDQTELQAFLDESLQRARTWLSQSTLTRQRRFAGWYLPYELEQYHWADAARSQLLVGWLRGLQQAAVARGGDCAISTYFSRLPTEGNLVTLWQNVLDGTALRPMVQDGIGVAGADNHLALAPLLAFFKQRGVAFDAIVELFHELPMIGGDGTQFQGVSADFERVQQQLEWARNTGAAKVLVYALEPWLTQDTPQAQALRRAWRL